MFYNETGTFGIVMNGWNTYITGSLLFTCFVILILIIVLAMIFRLSYEAIILFTFPVVMCMALYNGSMFFAVGLFGLMIVWMIVRNMFPTY